MNHEQATKQQATERYLLGDLSDTERDAFEEHYFECAVCADDVRSASTLVDTMRTSARQANPFLERQKARRARKFTVPLAAAASLIVGIGATYLGLVTPLQTQLADARRPIVPASYTVAVTRDEGSAPPAFNHSEPFEFDVQTDADDDAPSYSWQILDRQGNVRYGPFTVSAKLVKDLRLPIVIPAGALKPGDYTLRVISKRATNVPFTVR